MTIKQTIRFLVGCGLLLFISATAAAKPKPRSYAFADIIIEGNVTTEDRQLLEAGVGPIVAQLASNRGNIVDSATVERVLAAHPDLQRCREDRCSLQLGDLAGASRLLTVIVRRDEGGTGKVWKARLLVFAVDSAEVVGTAETQSAGAPSDLLGKLYTAFDPALAGDADKALCNLQISGLPPGGVVSVDDVALGISPFSHTVAAGRHTVAVTKDRFAKGQAEVDCGAGQGMNMVFTLSAEQSTAQTTPIPANGAASASSPRRTGLFAGGGVAAALTVGSAIGLGVEAARNGQGTCGGGRCPYKWDTTTGMAVFGAATGVFAVATIVLFAVGAKTPTVTETAAIRPQLLLGPNFAGLSLGGAL